MTAEDRLGIDIDVSSLTHGETLSQSPVLLWERGKPFGLGEIDAISAVLGVKPRQSGLRSTWTIEMPIGFPTSLELIVPDESPLAIIRFSDETGRLRECLFSTVDRVEKILFDGTNAVCLSYGSERRSMVYVLPTGELAECLIIKAVPREASEQSQASRLLTTREAAAIAGISPSTVKYYINRGVFPATYFGNQLFLDPEAVRNYRRKRRPLP